MESLNFLPSVIAETIWDYIVAFPRRCLLGIRRTKQGMQVVHVNQGDESITNAVSVVQELPERVEVQRAVFVKDKVWVHCSEKARPHFGEPSLAFTSSSPSLLFSWTPADSWQRHWGTNGDCEIYPGGDYIGVCEFSNLLLRRLPLGSDYETSAQIASPYVGGGFSAAFARYGSKGGGLKYPHRRFGLCFASGADWEIHTQTLTEASAQHPYEAKLVCKSHSAKCWLTKPLEHTAAIDPSDRMLSTHSFRERACAVLVTGSGSIAVFSWNTLRPASRPSRLLLVQPSTFGLSYEFPPEFLEHGDHAQLRVRGTDLTTQPAQEKWACFELEMQQTSDSEEIGGGEMHLLEFDKDLRHFVLVPKEWSGKFSHV